MTIDWLRPFADRTAAKLAYARVHLEELKNHSARGSGDTFERAHQESFLFHLVGVRDAFLQELNVSYGCGLDPQKVSARNLEERLSASGNSSPELEELLEIEGDSKSWLSVAKEMRNHTTHRQSIPRLFYVGGVEDGIVHLKDPRDGETIEMDVPDAFDLWLSKMEELIVRSRRSATQQTT